MDIYLLNVFVPLKFSMYRQTSVLFFFSVECFRCLILRSRAAISWREAWDPAYLGFIGYMWECKSFIDLGNLLLIFNGVTVIII